MKVGTKSKIKEFFYHSFRPRDAEDYKKLFTRGFSKNEETNAEYPWFYLRVFAALAVVYTLYAVINAAMPGAGDWETFYFVGGAFMDFAFIVLLYELYPFNDLSLWIIFAVGVLGGSFADFISAFFYHFHGFETLHNGWKLAVIAGVSEEIAKAVPAVVCIIILKKKDSPLAGFLIGAAVGTWFSVTENASYIHNAFPFGFKVLTATARAFGCMFSHAVWSALICWAFCKFRRPFLNFRFYAVVLFCMTTHFCIDMPLESCIPLLFAEASVCGLATFIFGVFVIYRGRKQALTVKAAHVEITAFTPLHKANLTAVGFISLLCALLLAFAAVFSTTSYEKTVFGSEEEFKEFAHAGYEINPDPERKFDEDYYNYYAVYVDGVLTTATQRVPADGFAYEYRYTLTAPEVVTEEELGGAEEPEKVMTLTLVAIIIEADGGETDYYPNIYLNGGEEIKFYSINPELNEGNIIIENGKIIFKKPFERLSAATIVLLSVTAATAAGGICTYFILRKKAKNQ